MCVDMKHSDNPVSWIVKPAASCQGKGIFIITDQNNKVSEIDPDQTCVVSRYVSNPFLINSYKFDLRLYVVVTCFDPLRIYYKDGFARFATEKYSSSGKSLNKYAHLTNYSLSKLHFCLTSLIPDKKNPKIQSDDLPSSAHRLTTSTQVLKWSLNELCK